MTTTPFLLPLALLCDLLLDLYDFVLLALEVHQVLLFSFILALHKLVFIEFACLYRLQMMFLSFQISPLLRIIICHFLKEIVFVVLVLLVYALNDVEGLRILTIPVFYLVNMLHLKKHTYLLYCSFLFYNY